MIKFNEISTKEIKSNVIKIKRNKVNIKETISLEKFAQFATSVANACFEKNEDESITFRPYYKDVVFNYSIVDYFTDIELEDVSVNDFWDFSISSDMESIVSKVSPEIISELNTAIDTLIEFECEKLINSKQSGFDKLVSTINEWATNHGNDFEGVDIKGFINKFSTINDDDKKDVIKDLVKSSVNN